LSSGAMAIDSFFPICGCIPALPISVIRRDVLARFVSPGPTTLGSYFFVL
jgi:hypothetical protein